MTNTELKREHPKFSHPQSIVPGVSAGNILESHEPHGVPMKDMWAHHVDHMNLVSPLNRRKFEVLVVGTGLSAGAAAAALGELGYGVKVFTYHDSPRRAHSIAAQGGVNASRAKKVDNDSAYRHTKDTVKGGDYRCRESDCWRLANESVRVIDHMNAIGAPFAREYGGTLATRSFGGVQVSRTYYTRGQTGQQLQVAAAQALLRQVSTGQVNLHTRTEMLDLIVADGRAQGIVVRDLVTGKISAVTGDAVVLATGVAALHGGWVTPLRSAVRAALLCLFIPPLVTTSCGRKAKRLGHPVRSAVQIAWVTFAVVTVISFLLVFFG